jgi:asparagine synthase (glutamine-hydrolysing)
MGGVGIRSFRRGKRFLRHAGLPAFDRFAGFSCYYDAEELAVLLGSERGAEYDEYAGIQPLKDAWERRSTGDLVGRMTYVDLKLYLPGLGLAYMDKASMAASVEVRVPLLDDEVVEYAARLPGRAKVAGTRTKIALRAAMRGIVPNEIIDRPKAPFAAPVRSWLRRDLAPLIEELLSPRKVMERGLLDSMMVQRLVREHRKGIEDYSLQIWAFLTLEIWMQEFLDNAQQFTVPQSLSIPVEVDSGVTT